MMTQSVENWVLLCWAKPRALSPPNRAIMNPIVVKPTKGDKPRFIGKYHTYNYEGKRGFLLLAYIQYVG